jgi:hypothetical protein
LATENRPSTTTTAVQKIVRTIRIAFVSRTSGRLAALLNRP